MLTYKKYDDEIKRLYAAWESEEQENDKITDGDEWQRAEDETAARYMPIINALSETRNAIASASQPRNEWFRGFCSSLLEGQTLTGAQFECFARYASAEQSQSARYITTFRAIVGDKLYTVTSVAKKVHITRLTLI